jgi:RNA polymerase sporulation-specific sigma factor
MIDIINTTNQEELNQLVMANSNLIHDLANQFNRYDIKEDLYQVGTIGIIKAYNNYNKNWGSKFSTYAYPYIVGEMKKYIRENHGIKVSRDLIYLYAKIEKARNVISQKIKRYPTTAELANYLEIPEEKIIAALQVNIYIKSSDEPIYEDGKEITLHDVVGNNTKIDKLTLISLKEELNNLSPVEKELFKIRYLEDKTQMETAKLMGMTQVQVSRQEQKVLIKLRDNIYH